MNLLGKLLFPNSLPYEQRRKFRTLAVSVVVGLTLSAIFVVLAFLANRRHDGL